MDGKFHAYQEKWAQEDLQQNPLAKLSQTLVWLRLQKEKQSKSAIRLKELQNGYR